MKPNLGGAYFLAQTDWRRAARFAAFGLAPTAASFLTQPEWPYGWLASLREYVHGAPTIALPGGFLLLIALLRWRRWEGRLFLALVCIPQTPGAMSALPLLLIPKTLRGMLILALLGFGSRGLVPFVLPADATLLPNIREIARMTMWTCYFPALYYLLRLPAHRELASEPGQSVAPPLTSHSS